MTEFWKQAFLAAISGVSADHEVVDAKHVVGFASDVADRAEKVYKLRLENDAEYLLEKRLGEEPFEDELERAIARVEAMDEEPQS